MKSMSIARRSYTGRLLILSVAMCAALVSAPVFAATPVARAEALLEKLDRKGVQRSSLSQQSRSSRSAFSGNAEEPKLRVIVSFDALNSRVLQSLPPSQQKLFSSMQHIRAHQDLHLNQLDVTDYSSVKRFTAVPQMALSVNRRALNVLLENPYLNVYEDSLYRLTLASSVPIVFPSHSTSSYSGDGWSVAVVDTGVDKTHSFLSGKVTSEACYSTNDTDVGINYTSTCPGGAASSTASDSGTPCDASLDGCDHGTRVAGIVAGNGGSYSGETFDGVATQADILSIKIATKAEETSMFSTGVCGTATSCKVVFTSDVIAGLQRVLTLKNSGMKIAAVNLSLGRALSAGSGTCDSEPEQAIISQLKTAGVATIVSAGNDSQSAKITVPACVGDAIAVGASTDLDTASSTSNVSTALDLYAPGVNITSSIPGGSYDSGSGTSLSAPHVAAAWAVVKQKQPSASVSVIEALFKSHGPEITYHGQTRRRIDLDGVLGAVTTEEPCSFFVIPLPSNKPAIICL